MTKYCDEDGDSQKSLVPWFTEKLVLNEDCDGEHDDALDGHGTKVFSHHIPAEWVLEAILT